MSSLWIFGGLVLSISGVPADSVQKQISVQAHTGFIIPHAPDLRAISESTPIGVMFEYSRLNLQRSAYERCNCLARIGVYTHYVAFNNPTELGRIVGGGAFFEPLIRYGKPVSFSLKASAGLAYLTRYFNEQTNPRNTFFGAALNGWLSLSAATYLRLSPNVQINVAANYNHISNGGTRQPNRGMNFPTASVGLLYTIRPIPLPNPANWTKPVLTKRWTLRLMPFSSIRTLPQTDNFPEQATWLFGMTATTGWRLNRFHAVSGGVEGVHDGYVREQRRRNNQAPVGWQLALLGGYELWLGRYRFTTHLGWNAYQPNSIPDGRVFQRYQLLYALRPQIRVGLGLKAKLNVAEGFDLRVGAEF
ncbi:acyloxyacyl hydrolase [Spirosoma sp. BT702]|uniref:Acyloxyacyl hydrolase n=1 Tax=Spirosoma profusum TaxID=2771354 RepID=A0A926Y004_9BACT|nr:acyloxyacyl hydrolase [Spirosoma profusum]MBD2704078.1 acyloxyacyl hydrolase [Spirosoma profusum]